MDKLFVHRSGDPGKPVLLFLHGFMGRGSDWREIARAFEDTHYCLMLDLPGHGRSVNLTAGSYTFIGCAASIIHTLKAEGVLRAVLVGYSMGGRLALYLALQYPEWFAGLFLESASPGLSEASARSSRVQADAIQAESLRTLGVRRFLGSWYQQALFASLHEKEGRVDQLIASRQSQDPVALARALGGLGTGQQPSLWERLHALERPALMLVGEKDTKYVALAGCMKQKAPHLRVVRLAGCGHNMHLEAPHLVQHHLKTFIEAIDYHGNHDHQTGA